MPNDLSRRGLLGLMAATPVAAVAKPLPAEPLRQVLIDDSFITVNLSDMHDTIYGSGGGGGGEWIEIARWPAARPDRLIDECIKDFNTLENCLDHPPGGPFRLADDEGPGAPAKVRAAPPAPQAHHVPSGAPVPDLPASDARGGGLPERSPGRPALQNRVASDSDHPILQHARAC